MRKAIILLLVALLFSAPITSAVQQPRAHVSSDTTIVCCIIDGKKIEKEMPIPSMQGLIDMGASHQADFMTIYDKTKTDEEVTQAFKNIEPFFQALIDSHLTDKTVDEMNSLYSNIREKIREPRGQTTWKPQESNPEQPLGIWNGLPTPIWANAVCGIFDAGFCVGFAAGTHMLIPTIGADAFITYGFQGTSISVGLFGGTMAFSAFQVIIGFIGILITLPLIMFGPYFMTGLCGFMIGIGV
jgi:hypothetical protein